MPKALSVDLKERIARYIQQGHTRREAAKVFDVSPGTAIRIALQFNQTGNVEAKKSGGDRRSKLKAHSDYIMRRIKETPDISLMELTAELDALGVKIHPSNVCRFLQKTDFTFKKRL